MKQLAWVQFFSWFALSLCGFTPPAVTQHIYGTTDTTSEAYNTVANQVGEMFANYNLIAAIASFIPLLAKYTSRKFTLFRTCLRRTWSYVIYFITEPPYSLWNGFQ
jgi:maltose/moltooligosaccharide transporter